MGSAEGQVGDVKLQLPVAGAGTCRTHRVSHSSPSVAVCFLVFNSLSTRDWSVSDSAGAAD